MTCLMQSAFTGRVRTSLLLVGVAVKPSSMKADPRFESTEPGGASQLCREDLSSSGMTASPLTSSHSVSLGRGGPIAGPESFVDTEANALLCRPSPALSTAHTEAEGMNCGTC